MMRQKEPIRNFFFIEEFDSMMYMVAYLTPSSNGYVRPYPYILPW